MRENLESVPLISGGAPFVNYRFADSKLEPCIQVADIVIGLLGKMHSYFCDTPVDGVYETRSALCGLQLENALLLRGLISASQAENIAFLHHTASAYDLAKMDSFLRYTDGAYI